MKMAPKGVKFGSRADVEFGLADRGFVEDRLGANGFVKIQHYVCRGFCNSASRAAKIDDNAIK